MSSIIVKAGPNDSSDSVIRKFQKRIVMDKVVQEYRDMMFHKKNSEKRKERLAERARKIRRAKRLASAWSGTLEVRGGKWELESLMFWYQKFQSIMEDQLKEDLKQAMLSGDTIRVKVLRLLLSELQYARIQKGDAFKHTEDIITVIQKAIKQRKESITSFDQGGRQDLVDVEKAELEILQAYLPAQLSDEELTKIVDEAINKVGATTMADMGKVISLVMGAVGQKAEGARVSALVKGKLHGGVWTEKSEEIG